MCDQVMFFDVDGDDNRVIVPRKQYSDLMGEAKARQEDAEYKARERGGFPPQLFEFWCSKGAEFAAAYFLHERHDLPLVLPDFKYYNSSEKSWEADLPYTNIDYLGKHYDSFRFHIKSSSKASIDRGYEESFLWNYSNKDGSGGRDLIFEEGGPNDACVLVYVPHTFIQNGDAEFYIRAVLPWLFIKDGNLFGLPKKPSLHETKVCLYTADLMKRLLCAA